jgi:hypothetical protein
MTNQPKWGAKLALAYSLATIAVVIIVHSTFGFGIFQSTPWHIQLDLPFPADFVVGPIVETSLLTMVLLFARYKNAGLKHLDLKKTAPKP